GRDVFEAAQHHGPRQLDQQRTQRATKLAELLETGGRRGRPGRRERVRVLEFLPADGELVERGAARATPDEHGGRRRAEGVCERTPEESEQLSGRELGVLPRPRRSAHVADRARYEAEGHGEDSYPSNRRLAERGP